MISEVGIDSTLENSYMDPDTDSDVISGLADAPAPPPKNKLNMISKLIPGSGTLAGITHKLAILKQNLPKMLDIQHLLQVLQVFLHYQNLKPHLAKLQIKVKWINYLIKFEYLIFIKSFFNIYKLW